MEKPKTEKEKRLDKAISMLIAAVGKDYFGQITFTLESGSIVNVKEIKSHKW